MTLAVLSFLTPEHVELHRKDPDLYEKRPLGANPPFSSWADAYATGDWTEERLLDIGVAIGLWLEGGQRWLSQLADAQPPLTLVIEVSKELNELAQAVLAAPWELIARAGNEHVSEPGHAGEPDSTSRHLALEPSIALSVVRKIGAGTEAREPSTYRLSMVFMPCQPNDAGDLSLDEQETEIRRACGTGVDLEIEESGSLDGLGSLITRSGACDVIHVSCPATVPARPALVLEGARGEPVDATAEDLSNRIGQRPRLLVVAAHLDAGPTLAENSLNSRTVDVKKIGSQMLTPVSNRLCQLGWPAVLTIPCTIPEHSQPRFFETLYQHLSQGIALTEALARSRSAVASASMENLWHSARLLLGPDGDGQLVEGSGRARPARPIQNPGFLDPKQQIPIAVDYRLGAHRRAFQQTVAMLRSDTSPGIAVYGSDELSRAAFAARVLRYLEPDLRRVVVAGEPSEQTILRAIREQIATSDVAKLVDAQSADLQNELRHLVSALRAIVEGPCQDRGAKAFVLVLSRVGRASRVDVLRALLDAFAGARTASRLLLICEGPLSIVDDDGADVSARLEWQSLDAGATYVVPSPEDRNKQPLTSLPKQQPVADSPTELSKPHTGSIQRGRRRILVAGLSIALLALGLGVVLVRILRRHAHLVPGNMVRFDAADVRMGVYGSARPQGCDQISAGEDCGEWKQPENVRAAHVASFELDQKEVTNDDYCYWLNRHRDNWLIPGQDGLIKDPSDDAILLQTKSCLDGIAILPGGDARPTPGLEQRPVVCVTWWGAKRYCQAQGKRLPSEAEWELAAKGCEGRLFPWGDELPRQELVAYAQPSPRDVGTSPQDVSPEDIFDLGGNVAEWVANPGPANSGPSDGQNSQIRGGSFLSAGPCQVLGSRCLHLSPLRFGRSIGFRCARDAPHE